MAVAGCSAPGGAIGGSKVTGQLTQKGGGPIAGARVTFCDGASAGSKGGPTAITDENGQYAIVGVKPGEYKIVVYKMSLKKGAMVADENDLEQIEAAGAGVHVLPKKYAAVASTTLTASVKSGSNEVKLEIDK
ncbi:hypothetical protein FRUB_04330 [Fimbriiglobus ruber]|uniref:Carboxypeptidase regulatory-like domain-containing protein n=1 Tax=Fimbriiglobus ruber TaxID=1908690 RepID=A0A225DLJ4_9BACT|nr:hypothetical protein FRUB_04330 [Fimbriiglobus ruber]